MLRYDIRTGAKKIKTKTALMISGATLGFAGLAMAVAMPLAAKADTQVVVTQSNPNGWVKTVANGGTIDYVASSGADGTGAVQFNTPTDASYTRLRKDVSIKLSDINKLSYMTKQISGNPSTAAVNLRLYIHTDGSDNCGGGTFDDVLVYEPYYNGTVTSPNWQTWSADQNTGFWWSNCQVEYNGHTPVGAGSYATNFNLSDVTHDFPDATVVSIGLGTGDSNSPWTVQADDLTVNDTTYNFENTVASGEITSPANNGDTVSGTIVLGATYNDGDVPNNDDGVQWAVRSGTCAASTNTVVGNVDGHHDTATWDGNTFSYSLNTSTLPDGNYCFVFNPIDDPGQPNVRLTRTFTVNNTPDDKKQCKDGGWQDFNNPSFRNQGDCVSWVEHNVLGNGNVTKIKNTNTVNVTNASSQSATTGNAISTGNTNSGNTKSGNASNKNNTDTNIKVGTF